MKKLRDKFLGNKPGDAAFQGEANPPPDDDTTPYESYQDPLEPPLDRDDHSGTSHSTNLVETDDASLSFEQREVLRRMHRGFSTSIADSFFHQENERVDCCSITCFGILQSDRDRYLLTGTSPPTCCRRVWIHAGFPLFLFLAAGYCAFTIPYVYWNQMICTFLVTFMVVYLIMQCFKGTWKRAKVRQEMLYRLHQVRQQQQANNNRTSNALPDFDYEELEEAQQPSNNNANFGNGQRALDVRMAHSIAGFYGTDVPKLEQIKSPANVCNWMWFQFQRACCGKLCGCHLQLFGQCALAQEARELETLLPPSRRRIDYITMQPMMQYYPAILQLRQDGDGSLWRHVQTLSRLSRILFMYLGGFLGFALLLSLLPRIARGFQWNNFLVLVATFGQALILLYFVYWRLHRFHISLDAVVKYFASGFLLSTSLAVTWEVLAALLIRLLVEIGMAMSGVDQKNENEYGSGGGGVQEEPLPELGGFGHGRGHLLFSAGGASVHDYMLEFGRDHVVIYAFFLLVNAYLIAGLIEELCKYFGFRMVDHPDFLSKRELAKAADAPIVTSIGHTNAVDEAIEQVMSGDLMSVVSGTNGKEAATTPSVSPPPPTLPELLARQEQTHKSRAAAITIAMVAVAIGFGCCENLVYVFLYNGDSIGTEISVLLSRALLPVHPIAAAIMSVAVIRRHVENEKTLQLGRIILPAVIFHGTFDYGLLLLDFWSNVGLDDAAKNAKDVAIDVLSYSFAILCILAGLVYYYKQAIKQRQRLAVLDNEPVVDTPDDLSDDVARILT